MAAAIIRRAASALAVALITASAVAQVRLGEDGAHLALDYTVFKTQSGEVVRTGVGWPVLVVTTAHWIMLDAVKDGSAFSLFDVDTGAGPIVLELADIGGISVPIDGSGDDSGGEALNWFLFTAGRGEELRVDGHYELSIHYERLATFGEAENEDGDGVPTPTEAAQVVKLTVQPLAPGTKVDNYGRLVPDASSSPKLDGAVSRPGLRGIFDDLDIQLTPQTAESTDELALTYRIGYEFERQRFGGSRPGTMTLDFAVDGRTTSERSDASLTGYSRGELSARALWLLGEERYYPLGVRVAAGYEGGDDLSDVEATVTAQVVASVPYVGDVLEAWQETLGFVRAFAPPFVSLAYVGSGAEVAGDEQDRLELEAGWIAPVAETWDLSVRWRHFDFSESDVDDEQLLELDLIYYPGGDLSQGVRVTFEDGYRTAVGDIGSTLLLGYQLSL